MSFILKSVMTTSVSEIYSFYLFNIEHLGCHSNYLQLLTVVYEYIQHLFGLSLKAVPQNLLCVCVCVHVRVCVCVRTCELTQQILNTSVSGMRWGEEKLYRLMLNK